METISSSSTTPVETQIIVPWVFVMWWKTLFVFFSSDDDQEKKKKDNMSDIQRHWELLSYLLVTILVRTICILSCQEWFHTESFNQLMCLRASQKARKMF